MRLSMWMIVNQLSNFEIETNIMKNAPATLRSARRAYATDCVHIYQDKQDVICKSGESMIRIKDIDVGYAFEIIQSIFDTLDDWSETLTESASQNDWQTVVDISWHAFHSPMIILNADYKMLAMTRRNDLGYVDSEWEYLQNTGYCSFHAITDFNHDNDWQRKRCRFDAQHFHASEKNYISNCLSVPIVKDSIHYGRINVVEKDRTLNEGDIQLLNYMAKIIAPYLTLYYVSHMQLGGYNAFHEMLCGHHVQQPSFIKRMQYKNWSQSDYFNIIVMDFKDNVNLLRRCYAQLEYTAPSLEQFILHEKIAILLDLSQNNAGQNKKLILDLAQKCSVPLGISLPFQNLTFLKNYYMQACDAIEYSALFHKNEPPFSFYNCAMDFLLENACSPDCSQLCALHPDIVKLARNSLSSSDTEQLTTLCIYLKNECSPTKAAQELYLHKNTLLYRIQKILDQLSYPIKSKYNRDYMLFSIRIMQIYQHKHPDTWNEFLTNEPDWE